MSNKLFKVDNCSNFSQIPNEFMDMMINKDITPFEYGLLVFLWSKTDDYFFNQDVLAESMKVSRKHINRSFKRLVEVGALAKKEISARHKIWKLAIPPKYANSDDLYYVSSKNPKSGEITRFKWARSTKESTSQISKDSITNKPETKVRYSREKRNIGDHYVCFKYTPIIRDGKEETMREECSEEEYLANT
jgi:biotin operon repressor